MSLQRFFTDSACADMTSYAYFLGSCSAVNCTANTNGGGYFSSTCGTSAPASDSAFTQAAQTALGTKSFVYYKEYSDGYCTTVSAYVTDLVGICETFSGGSFKYSATVSNTYSSSDCTGEVTYSNPVNTACIDNLSGGSYAVVSIDGAAAPAASATSTGTYTSAIAYTDSAGIGGVAAATTSDSSSSSSSSSVKTGAIVGGVVGAVAVIAAAVVAVFYIRMREKRLHLQQQEQQQQQPPPPPKPTDVQYMQPFYSSAPMPPAYGGTSHTAEPPAATALPVTSINDNGFKLAFGVDDSPAKPGLFTPLTNESATAAARKNQRQGTADLFSPLAENP
ncbi:hypothetical protein HDU83_004047 [Entophlyctis luteolus]|nr:hypothetical protein HDU83_004047 [Entophlyctis luteolus]